MVKITKINSSGMKLFNIITWLMIVSMIYYIGAKLTSLFVTGSTREVIIIETKDYLTHMIKTAVCNEILLSDEYLTEDRLVRLTDIQKMRNSEKGIDEEVEQYVTSLNTKKQSMDIILAKLLKNIDSDLESDIEKNLGIETNNNIELKSKEKKIYKYIDSVNNDNIDNIKSKQLKKNRDVVNKLLKEKDYKYMMNKYFSVDGNTSVDKNIFNTKKLLDINHKINKNPAKPQILIYHTHGSETYIDSRKGKKEDTVVGVGEYLHDLLVERYGYNVIHDTSSYDIIDGKWNRNAYDKALPYIEKIIRDNPSIELVIDLHRDSGKKKVVTQIGGVNVAKVMFFNGISRSKTSNRTDLPNENLQNNISFSLALQQASLSNFTDFSKKIYLKGYRYNQHIAKRATLIEVGNNKNTVAESKLAMVAYAEILNQVLD